MRTTETHGAYRASVEPVWGVGWGQRRLFSSERVAAAKSCGCYARRDQAARLGEYRERRQTALTRATWDPRASVAAQTAHAAMRDLVADVPPQPATAERTHHHGGRNAYAAPVAMRSRPLWTIRSSAGWRGETPSTAGALGRHSALRVDRPDLDDRAGFIVRLVEWHAGSYGAPDDIRRIDTLLSIPGRSHFRGRYSDPEYSSFARARRLHDLPPFLRLSSPFPFVGRSMELQRLGTLSTKGGRRRSPGSCFSAASLGRARVASFASCP